MKGLIISLGFLLMIFCFCVNAYFIRELKITNKVLIDEIKQVTKENNELIRLYQEMYGAWEYLDEKFELNKEYIK